MVMHVQTKNDNWNFSSAKVETFNNLVCVKATYPDHFYSVNYYAKTKQKSR